MTRCIRLLWSSPRTRDTHTYSQVFGSGAVTTCFYDFGLSRQGFKHPTFRLGGERSNQLRQHRSFQLRIVYSIRKYLHKFVKIIGYFKLLGFLTHSHFFRHQQVTWRTADLWVLKHKTLRLTSIHYVRFFYLMITH